MVRTSRKLPKNWIKYDAIGEVIPGTRIFAFKTPLRVELHNLVPKKSRFTTTDLFRKLGETGKKLGLVINVTNTTRYYDKQDIEGLLVQYVDIPCPGRGFLDHIEVVKLFYKSLDEFLSENPNDLLIGVHCTDGVNRSGYLICRYLIDRLEWSSHAALEAFETCRHYPIERGSYVQALHRADRERRVKGGSKTDMLGYDSSGNESDVKVNEMLVVDDHEARFDRKITAQMMQHIFNLEQQFKVAAEQVVNHSQLVVNNTSPYLLSPHIQQTSLKNIYSNPNSASPSPNIDLSYKNPVQYARSSFSQKQDDNLIDELTHTKPESVSDEEAEVMDFNMLGKIDIKESTSSSQQRRMRRKKRDHLFAVMKRGRFWEINEMRKDALGK